MKILAGLLLWLGLITNALAVDCRPGTTCCPDMQRTSQPPPGWEIFASKPATQNAFTMATLLYSGVISGAVCSYNNTGGGVVLYKNGRYNPDPIYPHWHPCTQNTLAFLL